jgi:cellulose synthase/poly-beta-1,6-N-acetylglucosamine synthase-like glycosyltransferase
MVYGVYFFVMSLGAFKKNRRTVHAYAPEKRFAVLIAARNEERVIADLIHSLKVQAYPSRLYDVFVIPNNCTDGTEQTASAAGARILHVRPPIKTKGDVLKQAFEILQPLGYDGYVILDADNLVSPNFLQRMNDALCAGYPAAQGKRESKNPDDNWITGSYTIYFGVINFLINRARMNMDCNAIFYGTGMMISAALLAQTGYPIRTVTEDMEYAMLCSLAGRRIAFVEDAVFYDEQPIHFMESMKQRRRWTAGSYSCFRIYQKELTLEAVRNRNKSAFDILLFAFAPMFQVLLTCICFIFSAVAYFQGGDYLPGLLIGLVSGAAGYLAQMIFAWFIVRLQGRNFRISIMGILLFPLFLMSWFPLSFYCFFRNNEITWEPIAHTRSCDISQI